MKVPQTGIDDFIEIRDGNYYFVDKSELISDIVDDRNKVYLFTRPRRFGKTLNLSMIDAFFNMKYKGNTWFDGLKVQEHGNCMKLKNSFPVISISMKELGIRDFNLFRSEVATKMSELFGDFRYLSDSDKIDQIYKDAFIAIRKKESDESELKNSLKFLCKMLELHHGVKPIVLIDEYDNPINSSFNISKDIYEQILSFLKGFYSSVLKSNTHMSFAVVTGIMQIAKESLFSGLNNLRVNNIFTEKFDERYGFTESEVKEICEYYGHPEKMAEAKEWYDGYRFGNAEIYNPWSIFSYVYFNFKAEAYWINTSSNEIIYTLIDNATDEVYQNLTNIANGEKVTAGLNPAISMREMDSDPDTIYSVMAVAGYLNAVPIRKKNAEDDELYTISIPNKEVRKTFSSMMVKRIFRSGSRYFTEMFEAIKAGDAPNVEKNMKDLFYGKVPSIVLKDEGDYQPIVASAAMSSMGNYKVYLEEEAGNGRADIIMKHNRPGLPDIVIEFKKSKSKTDSEETQLKEAEEAINQIKNREYSYGLGKNLILYGVCFNGKRPKVIMENNKQ